MTTPQHAPAATTTPVVTTGTVTTTAPANAEPKFPWLIPWTVSILYGIICLVLVVLHQEAIWWFSLLGVAVVAVLWIGAAIVHHRAKDKHQATL